DRCRAGVERRQLEPQLGEHDVGYADRQRPAEIDTTQVEPLVRHLSPVVHSGSFCTIFGSSHTHDRNSDTYPRSTPTNKPIQATSRDASRMWSNLAGLPGYGARR